MCKSITNCAKSSLSGTKGSNFLPSPCPYFWFDFNSKKPGICPNFCIQIYFYPFLRKVFRKYETKNSYPVCGKVKIARLLIVLRLNRGLLTISSITLIILLANSFFSSSEFSLRSIIQCVFSSIF